MFNRNATPSIPLHSTQYANKLEFSKGFRLELIKIMSSNISFKNYKRKQVCK
jgi:hypothetical protein